MGAAHDIIHRGLVSRFLSGVHALRIDRGLFEGLDESCSVGEDVRKFAKERVASLESIRIDAHDFVDTLKLRTVMRSYGVFQTNNVEVSEQVC